MQEVVVLVAQQGHLDLCQGPLQRLVALALQEV
jgi:hypothetical protein